MNILGWKENLGQDEIPPSWMWPLDHELESWFDEVEQKRKEKYGQSDSDDDDGSAMVGNELSRGMRK